MKSVLTTKLILSLGLLAAPLALSAKSPEEAYLESYNGRTDLPVPVKVVTPSVDAEHVGKTVNLEFVIDAAGLPQKITVRENVSRDLANELTSTVAKWKFVPLKREGKAVSARVVLPMQIVDDLHTAAKLAVN